MLKRKAAFLDRDGTLIKAVLNRPWLPEKPVTAPFKYSELEFVPEARKAVEMLKEAGYFTIIVTNQPDVANGYMTKEEWDKIHQAVLDETKPDDCFMCRHRPEDNCPFRKPSPMMLLAAADKWGIDLKSSFMIGDTDSDTLAGKAAGCKEVLIRWPYNEHVEAKFKVPSLMSAALLLTMNMKPF